MSSKKSPKKKPTKNISELTDKLAADILNVAQSASIEPWLLTKAQYYKNGGEATEWEFRSVGGFTSVRNTYFKHEEPIKFDVKADMDGIRKAYAKLQKEQGDMDLLIKRIESSVSSMPAVAVKPFKPAKNQSIARAVNVVLSDLHFGSDIDPAETGHSFGKKEEARAFAALIKNVCSYKLEYRDETELNVFILGDIIENELHSRTSADLLHLQACRAMYLLSQGISQLSSNFKQVNVFFAVGNHGRDVSIHKDRATALKYNAIETTIYYAVRLALSSAKNVKFVQPKTAWVDTHVLGHRVYATHGDTNLNPGNVGSKIDIRGIETQINKINAKLKDREEFEIFICGHVHAPTFTQLSNGSFLIVNGALTPPNSYAISLNIHESPQVQIMWETTQAHAVGDIRFIDCSGQSSNSSLDEIIKPFKDLTDEEQAISPQARK